MAASPPATALDFEKQRVRCAVGSGLFGGAPAPVTIDRFEIEARIGSGAMGVVYRAFDPKLDRRVAIKLLTSEHVASGHRRFLDEARALAKLSDPNVISVFDVGDVGETIFIATELIEGVSVRAWLDTEGPSAAEILRVFAAAGRGLAAAHSSGIVHRDFKPANVMLGDDGKVCVVDFGLALAVSARLFEDGDLEHGIAVAATVTLTGGVVGTPAYMAPEQHRGDADERSDQFSFCVSLYEALYGQRPFDGLSLAELREKLDAGPAAAPSRDGVPQRIEAILRRGMSLEASNRYSSMGALLADLGRDPGRRRRRIALAGFAVGTVFAAGAAVASSLGGEQSWDSRCDTVAQGQRDALWNPRVSREMATSFAASEHPRHARLHGLTAASLEAYARELAAASRAACRATRVDGAQSEQVLDLRMECLARRVTEASALVELLGDAPDRSMVSRAPGSASTLPALADCEDVEWLRGIVGLPADSAMRGEVERLRAELAHASALKNVGKRKEALVKIETIVPAARKLGHAPLLASALYAEGDLVDATGNANLGADKMRAAIRAASSARDDRLAARGWINLLWIVGQEQGNREQAKAIQLSAETAVERAGNPKEIEAPLSYTVAQLLLTEGKLEEADARASRARDLWSETSDPGVDVATATQLLGLIRSTQGRYREALELQTAALELLDEKLGEGNLRAAGTLSSIGLTRSRLGDSDEAIAALRLAVRYFEESLGPESPRLATPLSNLGIALKDGGQGDEAAIHGERSVVLRRAEHGDKSVHVAQALNDIASIYHSSNKFALAEERHREALAIRTEALGADDVNTAISASNLADTLAAQDKFAESRRYSEQALAIFEKRFGPEHIYVSFALISIGAAMTHEQQGARAVKLLERAVAIRVKAGVAATTVAEARFALADALWQAGQRTRAVTVMRAAEGELEPAGAGAEADLTEVKKWLSEHR